MDWVFRRQHRVQCSVVFGFLLGLISVLSGLALFLCLGAMGCRTGIQKVFILCCKY